MAGCKHAGRNASEARAGLEKHSRERRAPPTWAKAAAAGPSNRPRTTGPLAGVMGAARMQASVRNTGDLTWCGRTPRPQPILGVGPRQESEGPILPPKPVKAGGGKGPWFGTRPEEPRGRGLA